MSRARCIAIVVLTLFWRRRKKMSPPMTDVISNTRADTMYTKDEIENVGNGGW